MKKFKFLFLLMLTMVCMNISAQSYYGQDSDGNSIDVTWIGDRMYVWIYNDAGKMSSYWMYTPEGRTISITGPDGKTTTIQYPWLRHVNFELGGSKIPSGDGEYTTPTRYYSGWVAGDGGSFRGKFYDSGTVPDLEDIYYQWLVGDITISAMRSATERQIKKKNRNDVMSTCY